MNARKLKRQSVGLWVVAALVGCGCALFESTTTAIPLATTPSSASPTTIPTELPLATTPTSAPPTAIPTVELITLTGTDVRVPMLDGVLLATTIYLPEGEGPWPTILERTPGGREVEHDLGLGLAEAGIAFIVQDPRVRFESESEDAIWFDGREDGHATVAWIAAQPWSDGRVMTMGASTNGITQYMLAPGAPQELRCQWIEAATPDAYRVFFQGGVFRQALGSEWVSAGGSGPMIEAFKNHYLNDEYWDPGRIVDDYADVNVSAFHISGWYDIFAREIVAAFTGYQNEGGASAAGRQHLSWDRGRTTLLFLLSLRWASCPILIHYSNLTT